MSLTIKTFHPLDFKNDIFGQVKGTELYAFTVKVLKSPKDATELRYESFFKVLFSLSDVLCYCGELDTKGVLHYHGVIRIKKNFYRNSLRVKGFHIYLKPIFNIVGWVNYCYKNEILHCWENLKKKKDVANLYVNLSKYVAGHITNHKFVPQHLIPLRKFRKHVKKWI